MELDSFKAILLRKAEDNQSLHSLITDASEEFLVNSVVDALEKMAKPTNLTGTNANAPITSFGANLDRTDTTQLRDALGHHLSHYKAALKAHHAAPEGPEKTKMRQVADQHLEHALPLMHLAARAGAHSQGKLGIDYPPLAPWETNYTTLERNPNGRFKRDAKLLRARPAKNAKRNDPNSTAIPDYRYLEMPPHPGHDSVSKMPHSGGYPWEDVQIGSPADIDAKKAYLHIEDIPDKKEYTPHEFDKHPIRGVADTQADHLTPEAMQEHAAAVQGWRGSEHHKQWMEGQKQKYAADKEGYMKRGQSKGPHFYEGIPLQEQPGHIHSVPAQPKFQAAETNSAPVAQASTTQAVAPKIKKSPAPPITPTEPQPAVSPDEHPWEDTYRKMQGMRPEAKKVLMSIPEFAKYVNSKGGK